MDYKVVAMCHAISCLPPEPSTCKQALASAERAEWVKAEREEINSLLAQGTWVLAPLPPGKRALKVKWTYRVKVKGDGTLDRFKARLVAKGFSQMPGTVYTETFSDVAKYTTVRCLLVMATVKDLHIHQMDVMNAFLYGKLDEEICMVQPEGYSDGTTKVCKLLKSLYGLKQAPRVWFYTLEVSLLTQGFTKSRFDAALYILRTSERESLWLLVYVDDILLVSASLSLLRRIKGMLTQDFIMTDMGEPSHYLGMNIVRDRTTKSLFISHQRYTEKVLSRFGLLDCNPVETPLPSDFTLSSHEQSIDPSTIESEVTEFEGEVESLEPPEDIGHDTYAPNSTSHITPLELSLYQSQVGSLMYASICTRPDLAHTVAMLSQCMTSPTRMHQHGALRALRYLKSTSSFGLLFQGFDGASMLYGFTDANWAGDITTRRSTGGHIFMLGEAAISWQSKKQSCVALSSTEAEYMAATQGAREAVWIRGLLKELDLPQESPTPLFIDNTSTIALSKNPVFHGRTKHIATHYHYVRELVEHKIVEPLFCRTNEQPADFLTKVVARDIFINNRVQAG
ncbi:unnamed protein product [Closterium sp. NIES-53]